MKRRVELWAALAVVGLTAAIAAAEPVMVWDGDTAAKGGGWTMPKDGTVSIKPTDAEKNKGKKALEFKVEAKDWVGFGWNWHGWWPADAATDISGCDRVKFYVKITGDAKPADLKFQLGSNNGNKKSPVVPIGKYAKDKDTAKLNDGNWHEIVIPLKDVYGDKTDFDPKKAWEFDVGIWSGDTLKFSAFFDSVQFLTPEK